MGRAGLINSGGASGENDFAEAADVPVETEEQVAESPVADMQEKPEAELPVV